MAALSQKIKKSNAVIIIGLGNPGIRYENTYHNIGFKFLNFIAQKFKAGEFKSPSAGIEYAKIPGFVFVKSKVFMNESGQILSDIYKITKLKPENLIIVHDDSDIEIGKFKLSFNRSSGGHHGIDSIIRQLGTMGFWRLRIGIRPKIEIGKSQSTRKKAGDLVLKKIKREDQKLLQLALIGASEKLIEKAKP